MRELQRSEDRLVGAAACDPNLRVRRHGAQAPVANRLVKHHRVEVVIMQVVELRGRPWIWEASVEFGVQHIHRIDGLDKEKIVFVTLHNLLTYLLGYGQ